MQVQIPPGEPDLARLQGVLSDHRNRLRMSYDDLAEASGLSRRTLINVGTGQTYGDLRTWLILAKTLDVPLDDLLAPVWD